MRKYSEYPEVLWKEGLFLIKNIKPNIFWRFFKAFLKQTDERVVKCDILHFFCSVSWEDFKKDSGKNLESLIYFGSN